MFIKSIASPSLESRAVKVATIPGFEEIPLGDDLFRKTHLKVVTFPSWLSPIQHDVINTPGIPNQKKKDLCSASTTLARKQFHPRIATHVRAILLERSPFQCLSIDVVCWVASVGQGSGYARVLCRKSRRERQSAGVNLCLTKKHRK